MRIRLALTLNIDRAPTPADDTEPPYVEDKGIAQTELNQQQTWFADDRVGFRPNT